jgi:hyperosmotically inducible protein
MKKRLNWVRLALVAALISAPGLLLGKSAVKSLDEQVRHELIMLPYYGTFDNLSYRVEGNKVALMGQVSWPALRRDAEQAVKRLSGVSSVENKIEVLPLSPFDNRTRWAELRAIYGNSALFRYNLGAVAPIRIIVKNGHVTLEGVVTSQADKNIAGIAASTVPGVFSVTNNLRVGA